MLNLDKIKRFCYGLPGSAEDYPFDEDTLVFKVTGKIFILVTLEKELSINVKCDPEKAIEYRASYPSVIPGYHMNKTHWNTVFIDGSIDDEVIFKMIEHSYDLVVKSLTKSARKELEDLSKV